VRGRIRFVEYYTAERRFLEAKLWIPAARLDLVDGTPVVSLALTRRQVLLAPLADAALIAFRWNGSGWKRRR